MDISVVILAAGFGTRMRSSTPKVLHKISGYPMIDHIVEEACELSSDIHVVLYHKEELIREHLEKNFDGLNFCTQDVERYPGTGGALRDINFREKKVLVLCGDMPLVKKEDLKGFFKRKEDVLMSVFEAQDPQGYGRAILDASSCVLKIVEEKDASQSEKKVKTVNAGVYLFDKDFLKQNLPKLNNDNAQKEYYLTDMIELANKQNLKVGAVFVDKDTFMGVNSKAHLARAEELMQRSIKHKLLNEGIIMRLPQSIYIDKKAKFEGECIIENGVSIEGECLVKNSHIKANSLIEQSKVINSSVGPLARIRPQSIIEDSHIGNFVEVKKSTLKGVKAGHLSYLGDSEIDEGTNIGCGTITCNYDGVKKHKTIIGKNVFVGSDTQFVAPVVIEDEVLIAAGTTVTKDVKKGSLVISRHPLKMIENFYYKYFKKD